MLRSLWLRFASSGLGSSNELALARYYRDEGLHAELESLRSGARGAMLAGHERILYAAHSYFAA